MAVIKMEINPDTAKTIASIKMLLPDEFSPAHRKRGGLIIFTVWI